MSNLKRQHFQYTLLAAAVLVVCNGRAVAASLVLSPTPLFVTTTAKANVLLILGNSNNFDEDPTGLAVGSANPASKSEIARTAAKNIVSTYANTINMGLMGFQQSSVVPQWLSQSPYDASYDPANYVPSYAGSRDSSTKKFKTPNPTSPNSSGACTTSSGTKVDCIYYNVNLPFYAAGQQGSLFCYSTTANFDNGSETYPSGPWDSYKCYYSKTGASDSAPTGTSTSSTANNGNGYGQFAFSSTFSPTDSDLAQNILDFGTRLATFDVGWAWFSNASPGKGYLHTPIANLDSTQSGKINAKLATSTIPTSSGSTWAGNASSPMQNAGLSPITGTFMTAKDYFNGATTSFGTSQGGAASAPPDSCNKDFTVFLTNGLPNVTSSGGTVTYAPGLPYSSAEVANSVTAVTNLNSGTRPVKTYIIGFALPQFTQDYFNTNPPNPLDSMATAGGTTSAYYANDLTALNSTFSSIFSSILAQSGSAGAVAVTSGSVQAGGKIYQGTFNSADWSGDFIGYNLDSTGAVITSPTAWNAATQLNAQNFDTGRVIISFKPSTAKGIPFRWPANSASPSSTELDSSQITALNTSPTGTADTNGANRLKYVRGDTSQSGMRVRSISVLGDIVDSGPFYVGAPASNLSDTLEVAPYSTFRNTYASRKAMVYVGGNDGMMHGFDALTGNEKIAYVPSPVYKNLTQLTSTSYSHRYFVDGSPTVLDGFYNSAWHTVLVSGLAGGGQGYFAMDVTDPNLFSETNAATLSRWEFTDANDADLGYSFNQPSIVKLNNGKWAAIFGNGYNNTDADGRASITGRAVLFIVDLETGALIKKIDTGYGTTTTPNGLATPTVLDKDGNGTADSVYAGDLAGNMWKFDISSSTVSQWGSAYVTGSTPVPLFVAKDSGGVRQPITAAPDIIANPAGVSSYGWIIAFGTGKYIETGDPATTSPQTFYGIQDNNATVSGRSVLVQQTVTSTQTVNGNTFRTLSANPVDWTLSTVDGWYLDLPTSGERVISESTTNGNRVIFTTVIPSTAVCSSGGDGWLMEMDLSTGGALTYPSLDSNGDGIINTSDYVTVGAQRVYVSGMKLGSIPSAARLQNGPGTNGPVLKRISQSNGTISTIQNSPPSKIGRTSWREIFQ